MVNLLIPALIRDAQNWSRACSNTDEARDQPVALEGQLILQVRPDRLTSWIGPIWPEYKLKPYIALCSVPHIALHIMAYTVLHNVWNQIWRFGLCSIQKHIPELTGTFCMLPYLEHLEPTRAIASKALNFSSRVELEATHEQ
jgi:hypothetical protein